MSAAVDQQYLYPRASSVTAVNGRTAVTLSTSGGTTSTGPAAHPRFFSGFLGHPEQMATALLAVARVARTRFYTPPGMVAAAIAAADPVVTSNGDRLRFESFSACCGVYARLDVLAAALDAPLLDTGTTNVDLNPPMREALARVTGVEPLHLDVGEDVVVTTMSGAVTERKVPLPQRWLRGFAEVALAAAATAPVLELSGVEARRFVRALPAGGMTSGPVLYAVTAGRGARLTGRAGPGAVPLAGPGRLRVLEPLLHHGSTLRAYAAPGSTGSVWELGLRDARLVLALSPEVSRGFSGEGGVLWDLADSAEDADLVAALLAYDPRIDVDALARGAGLPRERVTAALGRLAAAGRVGWDCAETAYFHRELPYDPATLEAMRPRLGDARALVELGAVRLDADLAYVTSCDTEHVVRRTGTGLRCTCPWWGRHRGTRGPCKHVLAAELHRRG